MGRYCRPIGQVPLLACSRRTATDFFVLARLVSIYAILLRRLLKPASVLGRLGAGSFGAWCRISTGGGWLGRSNFVLGVRTVFLRRFDRRDMRRAVSHCCEHGDDVVVIKVGHRVLIRIWLGGKLINYFKLFYSVVTWRHKYEEKASTRTHISHRSKKIG